MPLAIFEPTNDILETFDGQMLLDVKRHIIFDNALIHEEFSCSTAIPEFERLVEYLSGQIVGLIEGVLKRARLLSGKIIETFSGKVSVFIDATITATPTARLYLYQAGCPEFIENNLAGHRFTRMDYLAIGFKCCGDKMAGLQPYFQAGLKTGGVLINKGPANMTINPIFLASANEEHLTGMFSITEVDTAPLPADTQSELIYRFWLSDGVGRNYTLEEGSLIITPINVR